MNNTVRINAEEHKYWNSDSADYWVSQKPALDRLLAPWARLLLEAAELSGGEQQRVTIARSLINNPKIILADEPTGNLDSKNGAEIMTAFDHLNAEGRTIIVITHDPVVSEHARRILTLRDGQVVSDRINENFKKSRAGLARTTIE